jgi:putative hydrolase of the HAD superfamily
MGVALLGNNHSQTLLIDADDTLWENNIYFERVIASVQEMLQPMGITPGEFRAHLNDAERQHIVTHGYGTENFTRSLVATFERFLPQGGDPALAARVRDLGLCIMHHPLEILDGVLETLEYLAAHHALFLVTKGDHGEQSRKIEASKLRSYFNGVEILSEKNAGTFKHLVGKHSWDPGRTWMIGNSPRSDINPAISAGINAVYIPHPHTWVLEHEEPVQHPRLLELGSFSELRHHF